MRDAATGMGLTILLVLLAGFATRSVAAAMSGRDAPGAGSELEMAAAAMALVLWGAPPVILGQGLSWLAAWKRPERRDSAIWVTGWAAGVTALWCVGILLGFGG